MKQKTLLFFVMTFCITTAFAQSNKKQKQTTGYAITAAEIGGRSWKEVKLINIETGEELQAVFNSKEEMQPLNARTGKPVVKKETQPAELAKIKTADGQLLEKKIVPERPAERKNVVNLDQELNNVKPQEQRVRITSTQDGHTYTINPGQQVIYVRSHTLREQSDKPFATNSAAMAYDKKHERLYYTPMGINQLRYIDLKSKSPKLYYFEDEKFGTVSHSGDAPKQITRMVIASDGNGYALSNDANHLIRFTTGKKSVITDLGALTDDAANAKFSIHSRSGYGGDMIADKNENLYLITANRYVFKISIANKTAKYLGTIKGLPQGFSTNGAMVEEGSKVIVASAENTIGYYRFDLNTLQAEKVSGAGKVFNASDLANGNLAFDKKKKDKEEPPAEEVKQDQPEIVSKTAPAVVDELRSGGISVFPNPVTNSRARISFNDVPAGGYQVLVLDMSGKLVSNQQMNVQFKGQISDLNLPVGLTSGTYLVKVSNDANKINQSIKIVVE